MLLAKATCKAMQQTFSRLIKALQFAVCLVLVESKQIHVKVQLDLSHDECALLVGHMLAQINPSSDIQIMDQSSCSQICLYSIKLSQPA